MIEFLSKDNLDEIVNLYDGNFKDGWHKDMLESAFLTGRFLAFAKRQDEKLIALLTVSTTQFDADIEGIVVDKEFRNKGHALELLDFAEKNLKEKGIEKIFLEVRAGNFVAQKLYEKRGFTIISKRKGYYADGEDALVMAKEIKV